MGDNNKYLAVEGIRGLACFVVVLSHLTSTFFPFIHAFDGKADPQQYPIQAFLHESPLTFLFSGKAAVFIFFVLSGFILTKVALKGIEKEGETGGESSVRARTKILSMSIKRYPRLMIPALASCVLAFFTFQYFSHVSSPHLVEWINGYGNFSFSLTGAIYSGSLDVFFLSGFSLYNPVLWTMQIELLGSFVVYLLCLNRVTLNIPGLVWVALALTAALVALKWMNPTLGVGLISFYGGYLFCIYGRAISIRYALPLVLVGLYLAGAHNDSSSYRFIQEALGRNIYSLCNFMAGFLLVYAVLFNERLNVLCSGRLSVFMGKVSFSVYLIHMAVLSTFSVFVFDVIFQHVDNYSAAAILTALVSIVVVYLLSLIFYRFVDLQGMKVSNWLARTVLSKKST